MSQLTESINLSQSQTLFEAAQKRIPGGVNSPVRAFRSVGGIPRYIQSAKGPYLIDADGNQYIDFVGSWGPMVLGHANPDVINAVQNAAKNGLSFGAPCELEIQIAEKIAALMPSIEKIRFMSSGTEATMTAIRLARGATHRNKIVKFAGGYHGHSDSLLVKSGSGLLTFGIPTSAGVTAAAAADTLVADFNDLDSVTAIFEKLGNDIAAIIVEPIPANMNLVLPRPGFLEGLRKICDAYGSLLIFDEVISGFRVALGGAQSVCEVTPDLTTLGKVIGGGMPVGALGGRAEWMDLLAPLGPVYQAGTLSGNPITLAAGLATLEALEHPNFYHELARKTEYFCRGLQDLAKKANVPLVVNRVCGLFGLFFTTQSAVASYEEVMQCDQERFKRFFHGMLAHRIYLAPSAFEAGFISAAHECSHLDTALLAATTVFSEI